MKVVERGINNDEELWVMSPALNKLQVCLLHAVTKSVSYNKHNLLQTIYKKIPQIF